MSILLPNHGLRDVKARKVGDVAKNGKVGFFVGQMMSGDKRHYFCGVGGRGTAAITTSGDIYPCTASPARKT